MTEPELGSGASGESVRQLQARLQALGLYDGAADGEFGEKTAASVTELKKRHQLPGDGVVDTETWRAVADAEQLAGAGHVDLPIGAEVQPAVGTVSEDQQWQWDGERWQPKEEPVATTDPKEEQSGHLSADGQWLWDGEKWQPVVT